MGINIIANIISIVALIINTTPSLSIFSCLLVYFALVVIVKQIKLVNAKIKDNTNNDPCVITSVSEVFIKMIFKLKVLYKI